MSNQPQAIIPAADLVRLRACEAVLRKIVKYEMTNCELPAELFEEAFELVKSNVDNAIVRNTLRNT